MESYAQARDRLEDRVANKLSKCNEPFPNGITKMVINLMSQVKARYIANAASVFEIGFRTIFKLPSAVSRIHKGACILVLLHFVHEKLKSALNDHIRSKNINAHITD